MWLLRTRELRLEWFTDCSCVPYAILSHRWQDDEVTFKAMQKGTQTKEGKGFFKVQSACRIAVEDGYDYIWIDTCCINKDSSAELSESINSMFQWYRAAKVCYAYLFDVDSISPGSDGIESSDRIKHSEWFARGWTLQELIAPQKVVFLDNNFGPICQKYESSDALSVATGIDKAVLEGGDFQHLSVAERMSWASKRRTTRVEDRAYSLLGLLGVSMPLLYGEGDSAFRRLQEEIVRSSNDHSVLAWFLEKKVSYSPLRATETDKQTTSPPLAPSPEAFETSRDITSFFFAPKGTPNSFALTNVGLHITLPVGKIDCQTYALLNCCRRDEPFEQLAIPILQGITGDNEYRRMDQPLRQITIRQARRFATKSIVIRNAEQRFFHPISRFWIRSMPTEQQGMRLLDVSPLTEWNPKTNVWTPSEDEWHYLLWHAYMRFAIEGQPELMLRLETDSRRTRWQKPPYQRGRVCAFTLVDPSNVSMAILPGRAHGGGSFGTSKYLKEGYPGIRIKSKTELILGEQTCVVDIAMRSGLLFCHIDRIKAFCRARAREIADEIDDYRMYAAIYQQKGRSLRKQ